MLLGMSANAFGMAHLCIRDQLLPAYVYSDARTLLARRSRLQAAKDVRVKHYLLGQLEWGLNRHRGESTFPAPLYSGAEPFVSRPRPTFVPSVNPRVASLGFFAASKLAPCEDSTGLVEFHEFVHLLTFYMKTEGPAVLDWAPKRAHAV